MTELMCHSGSTPSWFQPFGHQGHTETGLGRQREALDVLRGRSAPEAEPCRDISHGAQGRFVVPKEPPGLSRKVSPLLLRVQPTVKEGQSNNPDQPIPLQLPGIP